MQNSRLAGPHNSPYKRGTDTVFDLCFLSGSNDTGVFVSDIIRGGVADSDGSLLLGDQILSINGEDVRAATMEHAQKLLQVWHVDTKSINWSVKVYTFWGDSSSSLRRVTLLTELQWHGPPGGGSF